MIAANALAGLAGHVLGPGAVRLDLALVAVFASVGIAGSLVGLGLAPRLPVRALQRSFAGLLFVVGAAVMATLPG